MVNLKENNNTMNDNIELLQKSVLHWETMLGYTIEDLISSTEPEGKDIEEPDAYHCALCQKYLIPRRISICTFDDACIGCPIAEHSKATHCRNTPYGNASDAWYDLMECIVWDTEDNVIESFNKWQKAVKEMINYLNNILLLEQNKNL